MSSGILVMDKPCGMTSFQMVKAVRGRLNLKKAGHTGTLDPLATGVLPICLGRATKLVQFIMAGHKVYQGTIRLGVSTDTYDAAGKTTRQRPVPAALTGHTLGEAVKAFTGRLLQVPPPFSAVKHKGQPLYKLARKGVLILKEPRSVEVFSIRILEERIPDVSFLIHCTKGTYVRSIVHDLGEYLGCGGHLTGLRRIRSGPFAISQALDMAQLDVIIREERLSDVLITPEEALVHILALEIDSSTAEEIRYGRPVPLNRLNCVRELQGTDPAGGLPYIRLMVRRADRAEGGSLTEQAELVSVVAWPEGTDVDGCSVLRPLKVWPRDQAAAC
jgi:tRNA pseudouridine55 synthase